MTDSTKVPGRIKRRVVVPVQLSNGITFPSKKAFLDLLHLTAAQYRVLTETRGLTNEALYTLYLIDPDVLVRVLYLEDLSTGLIVLESYDVTFENWQHMVEHVDLTTQEYLHLRLDGYTNEQIYWYRA